MRFPRSVLAVALFAVAVTTAVSTAVGVDTARSIWGDGRTMRGLLTTLSWCAAGIVLARTGGRSAWTRRLAVLAVACAAGAVAGRLIGAYDVSGADAAGLGAVFCGVLVVRRAASASLRLAGGLAAAAGLVASTASDDPLVLLALLVGAATGLAAAASALTGGVRRLAVAGSIIALLLVPTLWLARDFASLPATQTIERLSAEPSGLQLRLTDMGYAWRTGQGRPFAGAGPANYVDAHTFHYHPSLLVHAPRPRWPTASCSTVLTRFAETGAPGALAWLLLFGAAVWTVVRRHESGRADALESGAILGFVTAAFLHALGADETHASGAVLACVLALADRRPLPPADVAAPSGARVLTPLLLGAACAWYVGLRPLPGHVAHARALDAARVHDPSSAVLYEATTDRWSPYASDFDVALGTALAEHSRALVKVLGAERAAKAFAAADLRLARVRDVHSMDVRSVLVRARLALSRADLLDDSSALEPLLDVLERAAEFGRDRQDVNLARARILARTGRTEEALELAGEIVQWAPAGEAWWRAARVLQEAGAGEEARALVSALRELELPVGEEGREYLATFERGP